MDIFSEEEPLAAVSPPAAIPFYEEDISTLLSAALRQGVSPSAESDKRRCFQEHIRLHRHPLDPCKQ
ncbi:MAG: hypothetical protein K2M82_02950 [Lachnospiraceae bacterium]|nr:hypothetical protein [Lachnospiraceae bacterium]